MYTFSEILQLKYSPYRLANTVRALNEHAALNDGLFESNVRGRPYVAFNALVLSRRQLEQLASLSRLFYGIFTKALDQLVQEPDKVLTDLGWAENLIYALRREPANHFLTPMGRFDFVLDEDNQWHLLEFNSDTPSGAQEITLVEKRVWRWLRATARFQAEPINTNLGQAMAQALLAEAERPPVPAGSEPTYGPYFPPRVGLLVQGRHLTDLAQVSYYAGILEAAGLDCTVGAVANLAALGEQVYLLGRPVDAIYRLFPVEYLSLEPVFAALLQSNRNGSVKLLNNLRGFFAQSKAVMAWIWANRRSELFTSQEAEAIEQYLPETHLIGDLPTDFDYRNYFIKEFYGREGAEVFNGAELPFPMWQQCQQYRTYVVQKRVGIAPVEHYIIAPDWQSVLPVEAYPCVGGFMMGGDWTGCYTRIGAKITDSFAQFIPTLVELA